jgi:hypothetical protein
METKSSRLQKKFLFLFLFSCLVLVKASNAQTNKAYGDNMKIVDSVLVGSVYQYVYAIYCGDVNQDNVIDGSDYAAMQPQVLSVTTGYAVGDLNGDRVVDGSDYAVMQKNVLSVRSVQRPH